MCAHRGGAVDAHFWGHLSRLHCLVLLYFLRKSISSSKARRHGEDCNCHCQCQWQVLSISVLMPRSITLRSKHSASPICRAAPSKARYDARSHDASWRHEREMWRALMIADQLSAHTKSTLFVPRPARRTPISIGVAQTGLHAQSFISMAPRHGANCPGKSVAWRKSASIAWHTCASCGQRRAGT